MSKRLEKLVGHLRPQQTTSTELLYIREYRETLKKLRDDLRAAIDKDNWNPILGINPLSQSFYKIKKKIKIKINSTIGMA